MARPRPVPVERVEKWGWNTIGSTSSGTPQPVSDT